MHSIKAYSGSNYMGNLRRKASIALGPLQCHYIRLLPSLPLSSGSSPVATRPPSPPGRPAIIITRCLSRRLSSAASGEERGRRRGDRRHRPLRGPIETDRTWDLGPVAVTRPRAKRHAPPPPPEDRHSTQRGRRAEGVQMALVCGAESADC